MNHLYYGDNLAVLRDSIADESVDLIYLDPPFNSNASYNVLFKGPSGNESAAQIEAFDDTWSWGDEAEAAFGEVMRSGNAAASEMLRAMRSFLGDNDMMAYLTMMAVRLLELHRVLKPTGSLYLHCDPTASHYLKILLDAVFGAKNYVNEISWRRTTAKADYKQGAKHFPRVRDIILRYKKEGRGEIIYNQPFTAYDEKYLNTKYRNKDSDGRHYRLDNLTGPGGAAKGNAYYEVMGVTRYWRYTRENMDQLIAEGRIIQTKPGGVPQYKRFLDEMPGVPCSDDWDDIRPINSQAQERLGYPTQKPVALLERILNASSNEGDIILDPFCGCGTTVHAAQKLNRQWIGIDVTHLAIGLIEKRLRDAFPKVNFTTHGTPQDISGARDMANRGRTDKNYYFEFEKWALSLIAAQPGNMGKKGADKGIDGRVYFGPKSEGTAIVSVKAGDSVGVAMIRDLRGVIEREKAAIGIFLTLTEPTKPMVAEAAGAGQFEMEGFSPVPRIQIVTVEQAMELRDRALRLPARRDDAFKKAAREEDQKAQGKLL
ncbi:MAG: restriction endonuclease [Roseicyclus sp.]|nr:restriction endonuclease [Roseicyclus sp.]